MEDIQTLLREEPSHRLFGQLCARLLGGENDASAFEDIRRNVDTWPKEIRRETPAVWVEQFLRGEAPKEFALCNTLNLTGEFPQIDEDLATMLAQEEMLGNFIVIILHHTTFKGEVEKKFFQSSHLNQLKMIEYRLDQAPFVEWKPFPPPKPELVRPTIVEVTEKMGRKIKWLADSENFSIL